MAIRTLARSTRAFFDDPEGLRFLPEPNPRFDSRGQVAPSSNLRLRLAKRLRARRGALLKGADRDLLRHSHTAVAIIGPSAEHLRGKAKVLSEVPSLGTPHRVFRFKRIHRVEMRA